MGSGTNERGGRAHIYTNVESASELRSIISREPVVSLAQPTFRFFFTRALSSGRREEIRTRGPGAKTVMCRLNVSGDSRLFPTTRTRRARFADYLCVCARVTNYMRALHARLTRKESARGQRENKRTKSTRGILSREQSQV